MATCKINGCGGLIYVKSAALCSKHYNRLVTTGTTGDGQKPRNPFPVRFWGKVQKRGQDDCWPWVGNSWTHGYGSISEGGRNGRRLQSNRAAWILTYGEIPKGQVVRHLCHNRACCNPRHLRLGSRADNVQDMWDREEGAPKGASKLTESQVLAIRQDPRCPKEVAKVYGVTKDHISAIRRGRCWSSL